MRRKTKVSVEEIVDGVDLPHKRRDGWKWVQTDGAPTNKPGFSRERLIFYAGRLRDLGMSDADIACLISDLYWDSFIEAQGNKIFEKTNIEKP